MFKNHNIICFGPSDWWTMNPSCATHIMRKLAETNKILYVNPISSDLLGIRGQKGLSRRIFRKLKSILKLVRKVGPRLFVVSPIFLPIQGVSFIDGLNNKMVKIQIALIMFLLGMDKPILWVENVRCADIIPTFRWKLVLYHVSDSFEDCPYTKNKKKLRLRGEFIAKNSDLLVCVSSRLYEQKWKTNKNVHYLPHGVDFSFFRQAAENNKFYKHLKEISHPVAGYFGTLTALNDINLLEYCALNLPSIFFVFAGQITAGDYRGLRKLKNTIFLGRVAYWDIAELCATFDVCLLPWRMTKWIVNCNPLKLFEYMASGKPIVSVPITEVVNNYSDVVSIASDKKEFCQAIKWELENDNIKRRQKRIAIAQANSWDNHNKRLSCIIQKSLRKKYAASKFAYPQLKEPVTLTHR